MKKIISGRESLISFLEELKKGEIKSFALYGENGTRYIFDFTSNIAKHVSVDDETEQLNPYYVDEEDFSVSEEIAPLEEQITNSDIFNESTETTTEEVEELNEDISENTIEKSVEDIKTEDSEVEAQTENVEESTKEENTEDDNIVYVDLREHKEESVDNSTEEINEVNDSENEENSNELLYKEIDELRGIIQDLKTELETTKENFEFEAEQNKDYEEHIKKQDAIIKSMSLDILSTEVLVEQLRQRGYIVTLQA